MLALAATRPATAPHLAKYFSAAVRLPSDWIMVANLVQTVKDNRSPGSLPAALRRAMRAKFSQFDEYQLAKYNKKAKGPVVENEATDEEREEIMRGRDFDLKRLVRLLHISDPASLVMGVLGKKYPTSSEQFRLTRLDGVWDSSRAGNRMKLTTPQTWETQVALRGNKPEVWQELIDNKKLPYMATVRNLRNLLLAAISEHHIGKVANYISNENAVSRSRMFPYQYFTAYDILDEVIKMKDGKGDKAKEKRNAKDKKSGEKEKEKWMIKKEEKQRELCKKINTKHIERIRSSLDKAVNIAARQNVPPLQGTTLVLCAYGSDLLARLTESRGVSQRGSNVRDTAALLSLMTAQAAEQSTLILFSTKHMELQLPGKDILANVEFIKHDSNLNKRIGQQEGAQGAVDCVEEWLLEQCWLDNIIIFHGGNLDTTSLYRHIRAFRQEINDNLMFACVNICGRPDGAELANRTEFCHRSDLILSGFSDSVFHLIVHRGNGGQLAAVESVDRRLGLGEPRPGLQAVPSPPLDLQPALQWRQVRIFVSSTFLDMEAERDFLHRWVLPALQRRASERLLQVELVDLRWGVTAAANLTSRTGAVQVCLEQVEQCQLFLGILGARYGWVPEPAVLAGLPTRFQPILKPGTSVTELEMEVGALGQPDAARDRAFFYTRDGGFMSQLGTKQRERFQPCDEVGAARLAMLVQRVRSSGLELMSNYPATCHTTQQSSRVGGLQKFGQRVLDNLWGAISTLYPAQPERAGEVGEELSTMVARLAQDWVGRSRLLGDCLAAVRGCQGGVVSVTGPPGAGSTALLARLAWQLQQDHAGPVLTYLSEAAARPGLQAALHYLAGKLGGEPGKQSSLAGLAVALDRGLKQQCRAGARLVLCLDCGDLERAQDWDPAWLPQLLPEGVVLVLRTHQPSKFAATLKQRKDTTEIVVKPMEMKDRIEVCRFHLAKKGKSLDESAFNNQLMALVSKRDSGSPSYLKLAIEKITKDSQFDTLSQDIERLGGTSGQILLSLVEQAEVVWGEKLVRQLLLLLSYSQTGLTYTELTTLTAFWAWLEERKVDLASDTERLQSELAEFQTTGRPATSLLDICLCLEGVRPLLQEAVGLQLAPEGAAVARERYIARARPGLAQQVHCLLAAPLLAQYRAGACSPAHLASLAHSLGQAGQAAPLKALLCSPGWVAASLKLGRGHQLIRDFSGSLLPSRLVRERFCRESVVVEWREVLRTGLASLLPAPALLPQLLLNLPSTSLVRARYLAEGGLPSDAGLTIFLQRGGAGERMSGYLLRQGSPASCLARSGNSIITGHQDGSIVFSDDETGAEEFCLVGHGAAVVALGWMGPGLMLSASEDGLLSSWDTTARVRQASARAGDGKLTALAARDGTAASAGWDGAVRLWDRGLRCVHTLQPGHGPLTSLVLHPTKLLAITAGWDGTVRVWDLETRQQRAVLRGHTSSVRAVRLSRDCRQIVSGAQDGEVKVWDTGSGVGVATITTGITDLASLELDTDDNKVLVSDKTGKVTAWPLSLGTNLGFLLSSAIRIPLYSQPGTGGHQLQPTTLHRQVTQLHTLAGWIALGFNNGDFQLVRLDEKLEIQEQIGWKLFESEVTLLGGKSDYNLMDESVNWLELMDEDESEQETLSSSSSSSDDLENMDEFFMPDEDLFGETIEDKSFTSLKARFARLRRSIVGTVWVGSGSSLQVFTLFQDGEAAVVPAGCSVRLAGLGSPATSLVLHQELMVVPTRAGLVHLYPGHPAGQTSVLPTSTVDTKHAGPVLLAVPAGFNQIFTTGPDRRLQAWQLDSSQTKLVECGVKGNQQLPGRPVGLVATKVKTSPMVWVGLEDGRLVRVEVTLSGEWTEFGSPQCKEGSGQGALRLTGEGDFLLLEQTGGLVSLWSSRGAEVCRYERSSTAALLCQTWHESGSYRLLLAGEQVEILDPLQPECREKFCGHEGPLGGLLPGPGGLLTAGQDGRLVSWGSGGQLCRGRGGPEPPTAVLWCGGGDWLVVGRRGGLTWLTWQGKEVEQRAGQALEPGHYQAADCVHLAEGGVVLVTATRQGHVSLWRLQVLSHNITQVGGTNLT